MEPCIAYEGIQVMQKCSAYDIVSQHTQNEINTMSKSETVTVKYKIVP